MAASKQILTLTEDLTCSICLSLFVEPVRLDCEHNFCKSCIQKCWENQGQAVSCPECQLVLPQRSYTSNRVLANLSEKAQQLELNLKLEEGRPHCEEHGEKLNRDTEKEQPHCEEHGEKLNRDTEKERSQCEEHGEKLNLKLEEGRPHCEEHGEKLNRDTEKERPHCEEHGEKLNRDTEKERSQCEEHGEKLNLKLEEGRSHCEEHGEKLNRDTEEGRSHCEEHDEKLKLFCEEDQTLICVICRDSPAHSEHRFLPVQDAVRKYKDQLKSALDSMEDEKKSKSELKRQQEGKISELDELTGSLEQDIAAQFAKIHRYLEDKEKHLIEELRRQKEEDLRSMETNLRRIEDELTSLEENILNLCADIEQQDSISFLKVNVAPELPGSVLELVHRLLSPYRGDAEELKRLRERHLGKGEEGDGAERGEDEEILVSASLKYTVFRGPLLYTVWKEMKQIISPVPASLTLYPNTAHRELILSEDRTSVSPSNRGLQLPDNPERFDTCLCVLGSQGFTSGKHDWEVEVADKTEWDVGVARESANRKGPITLGPERGYWAVWLRNGNEYGAVHRRSVPLTPSVKPRTLGVYLDYEGGQVTFYNADDMSNLYTFTDTFTEKLFPYFFPGSHEEGKNAAPLKLRHFEP